MLVQIAEIKETIDAAKQMVRGNVGVEIETVEQWSLRNLLASHHLDALDLRPQHSTTRHISRSAKDRVFQQNRPAAASRTADCRSIGDQDILLGGNGRSYVGA